MDVSLMKFFLLLLSIILTLTACTVAYQQPPYKPANVKNTVNSYDSTISATDYSKDKTCLSSNAKTTGKLNIDKSASVYESIGAFEINTSEYLLFQPCEMISQAYDFCKTTPRSVDNCVAGLMHSNNFHPEKLQDKEKLMLQRKEEQAHKEAQAKKEEQAKRAEEQAKRAEIARQLKEYSTYICNNERECKRAFTFTQIFISENSDRKIQIATDTVIETYGGGVFSMKAVKTPLAGSKEKIELFCDICGAMFYPKYHFFMNTNMQGFK